MVGRHFVSHLGRQPQTLTLYSARQNGGNSESDADSAKERKLEAYATLFSGVSSDLSELSRSCSRAPAVATRRRKVA